MSSFRRLWAACRLRIHGVWIWFWRGGGAKFSDAFLKRRGKRGAEIQKDVFRCIAYFLLFHKEVGFSRSEDFRVTK